MASKFLLSENRKVDRVRINFTCDKWLNIFIPQSYKVEFSALTHCSPTLGNFDTLCTNFMGYFDYFCTGVCSSFEISLCSMDETDHFYSVLRKWVPQFSFLSFYFPSNNVLKFHSALIFILMNSESDEKNKFRN